jgi:hypothetical protein
MGDKGGKKNKDKSQKQKTKKHEHAIHEKQDHQTAGTLEVKNSLLGSRAS